jgi:hypothetical protein
MTDSLRDDDWLLIQRGVKYANYQDVKKTATLLTQAQFLGPFRRNLLLQHELIILDIVKYSTALVTEKDYWYTFYEQKQAKVDQLSL